MTTPDERPVLWIGHVNLTVGDVEASYAFYQRLGMRPVHQTDGLAITELRGGTHVILEAGEPHGGDAPFDLMVDDLPSIHQRWRDEGLDVSEIIPGDIHNVFVVTDPDGHRVVVYDSHAIGPV